MKIMTNKVISNVHIFGLSNAIKGSKYPMQSNIENVKNKITKNTIKLGTCPTGTAHDQFLTGIIAQFDLTFTNKVWVEAERYHFFDFISSQSTMHRISKFDLDKQYLEYVDPRMIKIMKELKDKYNQTQDKEDYLKLLYSNPCGFKLTAKMTTNYRQLKTIYFQRRNHRLPEWRIFCKQLEDFPYFKLLVIGDNRYKDFEDELVYTNHIKITENEIKIGSE